MRTVLGTVTQFSSFSSATTMSEDIGMLRAPTAPMLAMLPSSEKISEPGRAKPRSTSTRCRSPVLGPKKFCTPISAVRSFSMRCVAACGEPVAAEGVWSMTMMALSGRASWRVPMRSRLRLCVGQYSSCVTTWSGTQAMCSPGSTWLRPLWRARIFWAIVCPLPVVFVILPTCVGRLRPWKYCWR